MRPPSLEELCMKQVAWNIVLYGEHLHFLPVDIQLMISRIAFERKPGPSFEELEIICNKIWKPTSLSLRSVPHLNVRGMTALSCMSTSLVKLDFSGCGSWLYSLSFLPGLFKLQCLNLRDCWHLSGDCLGFVMQLPDLRCLDLENVPITDEWASYFIAGVTRLQALNMSRTLVTDNFVDSLTYGIRLESWAGKQKATQVGTIEDNDWVSQQNSRWYQPLDIIFLRLQNTNITERSLQYLSSFKQLKLLDLRSTELSGRSLQHIKGKYSLLSLPNSSKILGKTNSIILSVLRGSCGCSSQALDVLFEDSDISSYRGLQDQTNIFRYLQMASIH